MTFSREHPLIFVFFQMCLLRHGPRVLPASGFLFVVLMLINMLIALVGFLNDYDPEQAIIRVIADTVTSLGLVATILMLAGKAVRIQQSLMALLGTGSIIGLFSLPFIWLLSASGIESGIIGLICVMILYGLFIWNIVIIGYIFSQALSINLTAGVLTSVAYVFLTLIILHSLFPFTV